MNKFVVQLTQAEFDSLNRDYPPGDNSSQNCGDRALRIAKIYFTRIGSKPVPVPPGADLAVRLPDRRDPLIVEVKGTRADHIAIGQLKVSGTDSYRLLVNDGIPLYRVIRVFEREPNILEMYHGRDFRLDKEPRWRAASVISSTPIQPPRCRWRLMGTVRWAKLKLLGKTGPETS